MIGKKYANYGCIVTTVFAIAVCSCGKDGSNPKKTKAEVKSSAYGEGFFGWDSLILQNQFVRLDIVPELGGKVMGYSLHGFQILWHDPKNEGRIDTDQGYGPNGKFFNPGGAKVWPAPQGWGGSGEWPGPPDNVIDSAPYQYERQGNTVIVTSPEDNGEGRTGLQFVNSYTVNGPNSVVNLDLSMKNVVNRSVTWSLWHLATVPVDRPLTVFVPVDEGNWHVMFGDENPTQWLGVENGLFRAKYDGRVGKVGMKVREGWAAWFDEENQIVYALVFPVVKGKQYPDGGSNFEIWTNGAGKITSNGTEQTYEYTPETAFMELEVLGPLTTLTPGQSSSMKVQWGVARCSGVKRVTPSCVVVEELVCDKEGVHGKFGVFYSGNLETVYMRNNGDVLSHQFLSGVSPISEVVIDQKRGDLLTERADFIRYQIRGADKTTINILGDVALIK